MRGAARKIANPRYVVSAIKPSCGCRRVRSEFRGIRSGGGANPAFALDIAKGMLHSAGMLDGKAATVPIIRPERVRPASSVISSTQANAWCSLFRGESRIHERLPDQGSCSKLAAVDGKDHIRLGRSASDWKKSTEKTVRHVLDDERGRH